MISPTLFETQEGKPPLAVGGTFGKGKAKSTQKLSFGSKKGSLQAERKRRRSLRSNGKKELSKNPLGESILPYDHKRILSLRLRVQGEKGGLS